MKPCKPVTDFKMPCLYTAHRMCLTKHNHVKILYRALLVTNQNRTDGLLHVTQQSVDELRQARSKSAQSDLKSDMRGSTV